MNYSNRCFSTQSSGTGTCICVCLLWGAGKKKGDGIVTKISTEGYLDLPRMPSRRAFMLGKTFFMIFPKSAALRA